MIEILVIIFIIGVLTAIAVPSFAGMLESAKLNQATTELRVALQETQRQSIRNNQPCETRFLIPGDPYSAARIQGSCLVSGDRTLPAAIGVSTNVLPDASPLASGIPDETTTDSRFPKVHQAGLFGPLIGWISEDQNSSSRSRNDLGRQRNQFIADARAGQDDDDDDDGDGDELVCNNGKGKGKGKGRCKDTETGTGSETQTEASMGVDKEVGIQFGSLGAANFNLAYDNTATTLPTDHSAKFITYRPSNVDGKKKCVVVSASLGLTRVGTYSGDLTPFAITHDGTCSALDWMKQ